MNPTGEWQNFYIVMASAAAGLTGLQFVIMALIADMPLVADELDAGHVFATPTIVHFAVVLLLAAVLLMPWNGAQPALILCGVTGLSGAVFTLLIARRIRAQVVYPAVFEDWLFRVFIPLAGYAVLAASALTSRLSPGKTLFGVAAVMLLLLFLGIHNAWDNVTYLVFEKKRKVDR